jgi:hypothetical protein
MKQMIDVEIPLSDYFTDCQTLADIKNLVEKLIELYGSDTLFEIHHGYDSISESVITKREETDSEYKKRLKREDAEAKKLAKINENKAIKERREYERLKKKFGDV